MKRLLFLLLLTTLPAVAQAQFSYTTQNGAVTITGYTGSGGTVIIPSTINSLPVTSIGGDAFYLCTNLTSVTISNGVNSIGNYVFSFCTNLTSINIPASITNIGINDFRFLDVCSG